MDTIEIKAETNKGAFPIHAGAPNIVNQESNFARTSDALGHYYQGSGQYLFDRSCKQNSQLNLVDPGSVEEQPAYDANCVRITVKDLLNPSLKLNSISETQFNLILEVNDIDEINQLQEILSKQSEAEFIDRIRGLDLKNIRIDANTGEAINGLLIVISQNLTLFSNLSALRIGDIRQDTTFKIVASLSNFRTIITGEIGNNAVLEFSDTTENLNNLTVGDIGIEVKFILFNLLPRLRNLTIGNVARNCTIKFLKSLDELACFTIGDVGRSAIVELLASLSGIKKMSIGNVGKEATFQFPDMLDSLEDLAIGEVWSGVKLDLPVSMKGLKRCTVGYISEKANIVFPDSLESLIELIIGDIFHNAIVKLPTIWDNLKNLSIGDVWHGVTINLPKTHKGLKSFVCGRVYDPVVFEILESLKKYVYSTDLEKSVYLLTENVSSFCEILKDFRGALKHRYEDISNALSTALEQRNIDTVIRCIKDLLIFQRSLISGNHEVTARILGNLGKSYLILGGEENILEGVKYLEESLVMQKQLFVGNHREILESLNNLSIAYKILGGEENLSKGLDYEDAAIMMQLELGPVNLIVAQFLNDQGVELSCLNNNVRSIRRGIMFLEKGLSIRCVLCEAGHPDIVETLKNIAEAYQALGGEINIRKGLEYYKKSLENLYIRVSEAVYYLNKVFELLKKTESYKNSKKRIQSLDDVELMKTALEVLEGYNDEYKKLSKISIEHAYLIAITVYQEITIALTTIMRICLKLQNIQECLEYKRLFEDSQYKFIELCKSFAIFYLKLGGEKNIRKGLKFISQALEIQSQVFEIQGKQSLDISWEVVDLTYIKGKAIKALGGDENISKGSELLESAKKVKEKLFFKLCFHGPLCPYFVSSIIGHIYLELGGEENLRKSLWHIKEALGIRKIIPDDNSYVTTLLYYLGLSYYRLGGKENMLSALNTFKENLKMQQALSFGEDDIMTSLFNIGVVYQDLEGEENIRKGLNYLNDSLSICQNLDDPYMLVNLMNRIGRAYRDLDGSENICRGIKYLEESLRMELELCLGNDPSIGRSFSGLAKAYLKLGDVGKALEYRKQAYSIYSAIFGKDHKVLEQLKLEIEGHQANFFKEQSGTLFRDFGGNKIGSESRWIIFARGKTDDKCLQIKQKIQKAVLNEIVKAVTCNGWSCVNFIGIDWGVKGYVENIYISKKLGELGSDNENVEIAQALCFESMNLGIMKDKVKSYRAAESFTREYPELIKKIAKEHPEFFVDGAIVEACANAIPGNESFKKYILQHVRYMKIEENKNKDFDCFKF